MITWMQRHKKWLIITIWISTIAFVGAGFVGWGAYDFGKSQGTIAKVVALATISPIITGMGGNAGTQTLTIVVRGLSLGELDKENARKVLLKEIGLGILNGVVIGALVSVGAWFFAGNPWFGVVAGLAMICNMIVATLAGYFVPVILDRFHVDPALASGVFVTTCTDMFGFFAFLGLATILMSHLL